MTTDPALLDGRVTWRRAWKQAPRATRGRVRDAIDRGVELPAPHEAALAAGLARRDLRRWWLTFVMLFSGKRPVLGAFMWRRNLRRAVRVNQAIASRDTVE